VRCLFFHRLLARHRIEDYTDGLDPTARDFEAMLRRLRRRRELVGSERLAAALASGTPPDPGWRHLSFDDGFRSTLEAAEVCRRNGVPLTVFVCSDVLDGAVPWFVHMRAAIAGARRVVETDDGRRFDLRGPRGALACNGWVKERVYGSASEPHEALDDALGELGLGIPRELPDKHRFLDRRDLAELVRRGATVGSHGASHRALVGCVPEVLEREIAGSRRVLEDAAGCEVTAFSYPDGRWDDGSRAAVVAAGYRIAFAVEAPTGSPDRFAVPRIWLGRHLETVGREGRLERLWRIVGRARTRLARVGN